jgi:hypothetical protein
MAVAVASIFKVRVGSLLGVFKPAHGYPGNAAKSGLNGARSFVSSFVFRLKLVSLRQTFVLAANNGSPKICSSGPIAPSCGQSLHAS